MTQEPPGSSRDALFELSLDLLCVADTDGHFLELNPAWERVLGWSREELRSRPYVEFVHPDDREATERATARLRKGGDILAFENRYETKDGGYRWLRWNARVDAEADRIYAAARDVTEQKRAEAELRRREHQLREAERVGKIGYFRHDLRTHEIQGSRTTEEIAGVEPGGTWTWQAFLDRVHPDDRGRLEAGLEGLEASAEEGQVDYRARRADGELRWFTLRAVPHVEDGEVVEVTGIVQDVTDRKRREQDRARLAAIVESSTDAVVGADLDRRLRWWNPGAEALLGYTEEEVRGEPMTILIPGDRLAEAEEILERVEAGETVQDVETVRLAKDGTRVDVSSTVFTVEHRGETIGYSAVLRDITERKLAEEELARMASVVASSRDGIVGVDTDLIVRTWNPGAEELFGIEAEEIVGEPVAELLPVEAGVDLEALLDRLRRGDAVEGMELPYEHPTRGEGVVSVTAFPVLDDDGDRLGFSAICRDVTERHEREEALRFQTALLESTNEAAMDGILVVDPDQRIVTCNERFAEMWGIPEDVLETRSDEQAIASVLDQLADPDEFVEKVRHLYDHPRETSRDEVHLEDGRVFDRYSAPVVGEDDEVHGRVWFFRDVTDRKQAQKELFDLAGELKRSNEDLERFASVISHDLREPLRMVRGSIGELVEDHGDGLPDEARQLTRFARDGVDRMEQLIDDLHRYARIDRDAGGMESVDPEAVLADVRDDLAVRIEESGAEIVVGDLPTVLADPTQLRQLLQNLLSNAIKFRGDDPPRIRVTGEVQDGRAVLHVEDNGVGIPRGDRDVIFGVFERADPGDHPGTGIGLATCQKIVDRHRGEIRVDSTPGEGSTFHVELPTREGDDG